MAHRRPRQRGRLNGDGADALLRNRIHSLTPATLRFDMNACFRARCALVACLALIGWKTPVPRAQIWTCVGSAYAVDESSAASHDMNVAQFKFKSTCTGSIYGRCNVTNPSDDGVSPG